MRHKTHSKLNLRARLKAANKRVSGQLGRQEEQSSEPAVAAVPAVAVAPECDGPSVSHTFLKFVDSAIEIETQEMACENAVPLGDIEDCAQFRRPDCHRFVTLVARSSVTKRHVCNEELILFQNSERTVGTNRNLLKFVGGVGKGVR